MDVVRKTRKTNSRTHARPLRIDWIRPHRACDQNNKRCVHEIFHSGEIAERCSDLPGNLVAADPAQYGLRLFRLQWRAPVCAGVTVNTPPFAQLSWSEDGQPFSTRFDDVYFSRESGLRSEEHTSELQSRPHLVCRLLLE